MSKNDKLLARLLTQPADFTWDELSRLLRHLGYSEQASGKTSGSRRAFSDEAGHLIRLHKPHPDNVLKQYQIKQLLQDLNLSEL